MSNQNEKRRARERMKATGEKYTKAARNRKARESLRSAGGPPNFVMADSRQNCSECGQPVRWVSAMELEKVNPEAVAEFIEIYGADALGTAGAWICPNCDAFGLTSPAEWLPADADVPDWPTNPFLDPVEQCSACGAQVTWIDPAQVASIDRPMYLEAKRDHGVDALLDGHASQCPSCGAIRFYPHDFLLLT